MSSVYDWFVPVRAPTSQMILDASPGWSSVRPGNVEYVSAEESERINNEWLRTIGQRDLFTPEFTAARMSNAVGNICAMLRAKSHMRTQAAFWSLCRIDFDYLRSEGK